MYIVATDKGKPVERRGRRTTGLRAKGLGQRGYRSGYGMQDYNNDMWPDTARHLCFGPEGLDHKQNNRGVFGT